MTLDIAVTPRYTVFEQQQILAAGAFADIATAVQARLRIDAGAPILAFDDVTGIQTDLNWFEVPAAADVAEAPLDIEEDAPRRAGRPKLGVVAREVTLLPRHWEWLGRQPGGASVALRKLVEEARKTHERADGKRQAQEATYRVMTALAGDIPGYEGALRALYATDQETFMACIAAWPVDIRTYVTRLAGQCF